MLETAAALVVTQALLLVREAEQVDILATAVMQLQTMVTGRRGPVVVAAVAVKVLLLITYKGERAAAQAYSEKVQVGQVEQAALEHHHQGVAAALAALPGVGHNTVREGFMVAVAAITSRRGLLFIA